MFIRFERMVPEARLPVKATREATGSDIFALEDVFLDIGERKAIRTGIKFDMSLLPASIDVQIRSKSGLALTHGVVVLNSPGTIDRDYRGEIQVILMNHGDRAYPIRAGQKIAQMVFGVYVPNMTMVPVQTIDDDTDRGEGGFGSTGLFTPTDIETKES